MRSRQSDGFTLVEVCLAIAVMAVGVLSMCGLYALGYRENRQSVEDVAAAGYADAYLAPLVQGLSATNMTWTEWCQIGENPEYGNMRSMGVADAVLPKDGWLGYVQQVGTSMDYRIKGNPRSTADAQFQQIVARVPAPYRGSNPSVPNDYQYALVATRCGAVIQLAFRAARRKETLMSQPTFVAEVHFQGDPER